MTDWLKAQIDKLRAEASRGPVSSVTVFALTDPIMDVLARQSAARFHACCGFPIGGSHNASCTFYACAGRTP